MTELRAAIAESLGRQSFELWFGAHTQLEVADRALTIRVPSDFFHDWLRRNFQRQIDDCVRRVLGAEATTTFVVDGALASAEPASDSSAPHDPNATDNPVAAIGPAAPQIATANRTAKGHARHAANRSPADNAQADGDPKLLAFPAVVQSKPSTRRPFANLRDFVVGPSNRLAHTSAQLAVERPGEFSPLVVYGPTGVGKTHLLEGIWTAAQQHRQSGGAVYLTAEQFTSFFLDALRGSGLPNFRRKYRGVGLLIVDDLQFFVGKRATLVELLYTVNTLVEAGQQLVLAADRAPHDMPELGDELVARLEGGMLCRIEAPELETRRGIAASLARRLAIDVPDDVLDYVAQHIATHPRALSGALNRLHATSLALGRPIDAALAATALGEMIQRAARPVRLIDIERTVCQVFGLEPRSLQAAGKSKGVSYPRMFAMWLARKHTRAALTEIGTYFGRRSHTTVLSAQQKVNEWMSSDAAVALRDRTWNATEAVRALEEKLRTG